MDPGRSALLVVDLQNDTVGEQGAFADSGAAGFARRHDVISKVRRLVDAARRAGVGNRRVSALRGLGAETIVVWGAWTNSAVEHTCRDGADHGYEVVLVADGTATISDDWQQAALSYALTNIAELRTVDDLVAELGGS